MNRLKQIRFEQGVRQHELGFYAKIPQSRISLYENGFIEFKPEEKLRLASVLKRPVDDVFPLESKKKKGGPN